MAPLSRVGWLCKSHGYFLLLGLPAEGNHEHALCWMHNVIDRVPLEFFDQRPLYSSLTLWQLHASLTKHLRLQLHHIGVSARESFLYQSHDHVLHYRITALLDESLLVCLSRVVKVRVEFQGLHVFPSLYLKFPGARGFPAPQSTCHYPCDVRTPQVPWAH